MEGTGRNGKQGKEQKWKGLEGNKTAMEGMVSKERSRNGRDWKRRKKKAMEGNGKGAEMEETGIKGKSNRREWKGRK